jgi:hypothetical protein
MTRCIINVKRKAYNKLSEFLQAPPYALVLCFRKPESCWCEHHLYSGPLFLRVCRSLLSTENADPLSQQLSSWGHITEYLIFVKRFLKGYSNETFSGSVVKGETVRKCLHGRWSRHPIGDPTMRSLRTHCQTNLAQTIFVKTNSVALVREQTIPIQRPPLVGEVSVNFCG